MVPSRHAKGHPSSLFVEESLRTLCGWEEADSRGQARGPAGPHKGVVAVPVRHFVTPDSTVWSILDMIGETSLFGQTAEKEIQPTSLIMARIILNSTVVIGIRVVVTSGAELDVVDLDVAEVIMIWSATVTSGCNDLINNSSSYIASSSNLAWQISEITTALNVAGVPITTGSVETTSTADLASKAGSIVAAAITIDRAFYALMNVLLHTDIYNVLSYPIDCISGESD